MARNDQTGRFAASWEKKADSRVEGQFISIMEDLGLTVNRELVRQQIEELKDAIRQFKSIEYVMDKALEIVIPERYPHRVDFWFYVMNLYMSTYIDSLGDTILGKQNKTGVVYYKNDDPGSAFLPVEQDDFIYNLDARFQVNLFLFAKYNTPLNEMEIFKDPALLDAIMNNSDVLMLASIVADSAGEFEKEYEYLTRLRKQMGEPDEKVEYVYGVIRQELRKKLGREKAEKLLGIEAWEPVRREAPKVGRNDPCPCGSGKKYKNCCGKTV